jgi:hypothetical protein
LDRRELIKVLALNSAFPVVTPNLVAAFREVRRALPQAASLKILSPQQDAVVVTMAELILPRTDTPGAKDTRVNEFIDHILADWYNDEQRAKFLGGLADVDMRTQKLFGKNFVDASVQQQSEILRDLGAELAEANAALADGPRSYRGFARQPENNFYLGFRRLTLLGYFTSEAGFTQQLHEEIIPGRYDGCIPYTPGTASPTRASN